MSFPPRAALFLLTLAALPSFAATVTTDHSLFTSILDDGYLLEDFSGIPEGGFNGPRTFTNGLYEVTASSTTQFWRAHPPSGNPGLSTYNDGHPLIFSFTGAPTAVGAEFYLTDENDHPIPGSLTVRLDNGTQATVTIKNASSPAQFFGFFAPYGTHISELTVNGGPAIFPVVDNLYVGYASPEPHTIVLLGSGLLCLLAVARRKRASL